MYDGPSTLFKPRGPVTYCLGDCDSRGAGDGLRLALERRIRSSQRLPEDVPVRPGRGARLRHPDERQPVDQPVRPVAAPPRLRRRPGARAGELAVPRRPHRRRLRPPRRRRSTARRSSGTASASTSTSCSAARSAAKRPVLYLIYPQGNPLQATEDSPYLQLGECKYGRRSWIAAIDAATSLEVAAKYAPALVRRDDALECHRRPTDRSPALPEEHLRVDAAPAVRRATTRTSTRFTRRGSRRFDGGRALPEIHFDEPDRAQHAAARADAVTAAEERADVMSGYRRRSMSVVHDIDSVRRIRRRPRTSSTRCWTATSQPRRTYRRLHKELLKLTPEELCPQQAEGGPLLLQPGHHLYRLRPEGRDRADLPARPAAEDHLRCRLGGHRARADAAHHRAQPVSQGHLSRPAHPAGWRRPADVDLQLQALPPADGGRQGTARRVRQRDGNGPGASARRPVRRARGQPARAERRVVHALQPEGDEADLPGAVPQVRRPPDRAIQPGAAVDAAGARA